MGLRNSKKKKTPAQRETAAKAAVDKADATYAKKLATLGKPGTRFTSNAHFRKKQRQSLDRRREAQMAQTVKRFKAKTANAAAYAPHAAAWSGGRRRTRRRHRKGKDFDAALKRVIAQHRRYQIARGDKRFKATRGLVKWSRPNKTKRKNRIYYRKRKTRRRRRRR